MGFITEHAILFWIAICVLSLIIESVTMGLTTIWFAGGCAAAAIASLLGAGFGIQFIVFLAASLFFLAFSRRVFVQKLHTGSVKTNVDALIGERTVLTADIPPYETGVIKLKGQEWTAVSAEQTEELKAGTEVEVIAIEGVKAVIRPLE